MSVRLGISKIRVSERDFTVLVMDFIATGDGSQDASFEIHKSRMLGDLEEMSAWRRWRPPRADLKRFWKVRVLHLVLGLCLRA